MESILMGDVGEEVVRLTLSESGSKVGGTLENLFFNCVKALMRESEEEVEDWYAGGGVKVLREVVVLGCVERAF